MSSSATDPSSNPHVVVHKLTTIGKECKIAAFASVGCRPQDLKYNDEPTGLEIGDRCDIREYVTLSRGAVENGKTVIGNDCLFMANAHAAHDCIVGHHCILANSVALAGHVTLGNWIIVGGLTPIHQFVKVGDHAMLGGGFRAVKDVPPFIRAGREPLVYEGLNSVGLRRRGFSAEAIHLIEQAYTHHLSIESKCFASSSKDKTGIASITRHSKHCPFYRNKQTGHSFRPAPPRMTHTNMWKFENTGLHTGVFNMEYDRRLSQELLQKKGQPTVRVYGWRPWAVSYGWNQSTDRNRFHRCSK